MNTAPEFDKDTRAGESIWLELVLDGTSQTFELCADEMRAVAVGSLPGADLRVNRPGVAPLHFHIEREGSTLWIVPAYGSADLRLDTQRLLGPRPIRGRAVIEFSNTRIDARICSSVSERVTVRVTPLTPPSLIPLQKTVIIEPCQVSPLAHRELPSVAFAAPPLQTARPSLSASGGNETVSHSSEPDTITNGPARPKDKLSVQSSSAHVLPAESARFEPARTAPLEFSSVPGLAQSTTLFDMPAVSRSLAKTPGYLARIGTLSRLRPWLVWGLGSTSAFALSASITLAFNSWDSKQGSQLPRSRPLVQPSSALAASSVVGAARGPSVATSASDPALVILSSNPVAAAIETKGAVNNPELVAAVGHLVAGRHQDARDAYARLSAQLPNERSLAVVARILEQKLAPRCSLSAPNSNRSCPEVKP